MSVRLSEIVFTQQNKPLNPSPKRIPPAPPDPSFPTGPPLQFDPELAQQALQVIESIAGHEIEAIWDEDDYDTRISRLRSLFEAIEGIAYVGRGYQAGYQGVVKEIEDWYAEITGDKHVDR